VLARHMDPRGKECKALLLVVSGDVYLDRENVMESMYENRVREALDPWRH
jgi:hypothetical protein